MSGSGLLKTESRRPFAKHSLPAKCGVDLEEIAALYHKHKSVARVAKVLGYSVKTTAKWLRIAGVQVLGHRPKGKPSPRMQTEYNVLVKWQREHPGEKLPASVKKAAEIIGCNASALRAVLDRRKKRALKYLETLPPINETKVTLETEDGRLVNAAFIKPVRYSMNPFTYVVTLHAQIRELDLVFKLPYARLLSILRSVVK